MNTTILIKTNKVLKDDASRVAKEMGIPLTTVVNAYLAQFVREKSFSLSLEPMPNKKKLELWESISNEADKDTKNTKHYTNADELIADLKLV